MGRSGLGIISGTVLEFLGPTGEKTRNNDSRSLGRVSNPTMSLKNRGTVNVESQCERELAP